MATNPYSLFSPQVYPHSNSYAKTELAFNKEVSAADKAEIQKFCQTNAGTSARIDNSAESNKPFAVIITCLETDQMTLLAAAPKLAMRYDSFIMATDAALDKSLKSLEPPEGKKLIQLCFRDTFSNWVENRPIQLIKDIAEITGLSLDTIDLVRVSGGSVYIFLRLTKSAAQKLMEISSERKMLNSKYHTLETIDPLQSWLGLEPMPVGVRRRLPDGPVVCIMPIAQR